MYEERGDFVPFVLETYGAMTRTVERTAELIAEAGINNCVPQPPTEQSVLNEVSVELQRGVALCSLPDQGTGRGTSTALWVQSRLDTLSKYHLPGSRQNDTFNCDQLSLIEA